MKDGFCNRPDRVGGDLLEGSGRTMEDNYDKYAVAVIITFGAVIVAGLMAATLVRNEIEGFFFALAAATCAWIAGHAMLLDLPRAYMILVAVATLCVTGSVVMLVI